MSRQIDERIVEMRFDNKQFESATKETISTLDKLKKALKLDSAAKGLDAIDKAANKVNFSKMQASLEALEKRFSAFGTFTARIIENAADTIYRTVTTKIGATINYVTSAIKDGGLKRATNMENAHFQLQALLKDEEKVQAVMANASTAVDGTAYSLDVAAKAASQFAASGVQAGDQMTNALRGIVGVAAMTNSEFEGISNIFTAVAGQGRLMGDQLLQLSSRGLNAAATLAEFFNGVNDGSKKATEATTAAIRKLTDGLKVSEGDIREWVSKGKISFNMFSEGMTEAFADAAERANETFNGAISNMRSAFARIGAAFYEPLIAQNSQVVRLINSVRVRINDVKKALVFDEEIGNVNALSKQWTDFVLGLASDLADWVDNVDLSKPLAAFYNSIEAGKNIGKGFLQILSNIGVAFKNVFHDSMSFDWIVQATANFEKFTSKMTLTDKGAANLRRTFRGLFDVIDLLIEGVTDFVKAIIPVETSTGGLGESVLGLTGNIGALLSKIVEWIRESKTLNKAFDMITGGIRETITWIFNIRQNVQNLIKTLREIPEVNKLIEAMISLFSALGTKATPYIEEATDALKWLGTEISNWDWHKPLEWIGNLADKLQGLADTLSGNGGVQEVIKNTGEYFKLMGQSFNTEVLFENLEKLQTTFNKFKNWIEETLAPTFSGFSFGGLVAATGGGGMIYSLIKIAEALKEVGSLAESFKSIPKAFGEIGNTLQAYQKDLNASALIKTAGAIAILAAALIALSFVDTNRLMGAAMALGIVSGVLMYGVSKLMESASKGKQIETALQTFAKGLNRGINNITKGLKWKAIGAAVKDMGKAVAYIAGSIVALALLYRSDQQAFEEASELVAKIGAVLIGAIAVFSLLGQKLDKGMKAFGKAALGIAALGIAIKLTVSSVKDIFSMEIPEDYERRLDILKGLFIGLGLLTVVVGGASRLAGGKKLPTGPILALTAFLYVSVLSVQKLFAMDLPYDYEAKMGILYGIFIAMGALMLAVGAAGRLAGGNLKAAGTILSMCVFVGVVVAAIMILALTPFPKLLSGAIALGIVLAALGAALYGAGQISGENTYKSVLAMAGVVASIALSLGLLSMISWPKLTKACIALGAMLLIVAGDFLAISKITNDKVQRAIVAMIFTIITITASLVVLALQPWEGLLAGAASLSAVLMAFAGVMKIISSTKGIKLEKIALFLLATTSLLPITYSLKKLSGQPWEGLLAGAVALSAVLLSLAKTLEMISAKKGIHLEKITSFLACTLALIPITAALYILAEQPWEGLLAGGIALSAVLLALSEAFAIISLSKADPNPLNLFLAACAILAPITVALYFLSEQPWEGLLAGAVAMSTLLVSFGAVFALLAMIGPAATAAYPAILAFDVFVASFSVVLLALGALLEHETTKRLLNGGMEVMGKLGTAIGDFVGNIIAGIGQGIGNALEGIGEGLGAFWEHAEPFFDGVSGIDPSCIEGIKMLAQAVLILTASDVISGFAAFVGIETTSLSEFGKQLEEMAPSIKAYGEAVAGINGAQVAASAMAIEILATAASKLPRKSEWIDKVFGQKQTLAEFGEELKKFGPAIKAYGESVAGLDAGAVEASATAAQAMSELANGLPKHGGFLQDFLGDSDLETFGKQLTSFGKSLRQYSNIVGNGAIDGEAVEASAAAGQIMVDLAESLPNSGGAISYLTGDNDIDDFGKMLVVFGTSMAAYSAAVSMIDPDAIAASASAGQMLVDLSNSLENSGGFVSLFTGDNTLDAFGEQLVDFGTGLGQYYLVIAHIKADKVSEITATVKELAQLAATIGSAENLVAFAEQLSQIGDDGIQRFIKAFETTKQKVISTMNSWAKSVIDTLKKQLPANTFTKIGSDSVNALANGIKAKQATATSAMTGVCNAIVNAAKSALKADAFTQAANTMMTAFVNGIKNAQSNATNAVTNMANAVHNTIKTTIQNQDYASIGATICTNFANGVSNNVYRIKNAITNEKTSIYNKFYEVGEYAGKGLQKGIEDMVSRIANAATNAAKSAANAAKRELQEHSPSRVFRSIGNFAGEGLELGILDWISKVSTAGSEIANSAVDPVETAVDVINGLLQDGFSDDLVLTPYLDLSQIQASSRELASLLDLDTAIGATYNKAMAAVGSFEARKAAEINSDQGSKKSSEKQAPTFIQNNYSPKSLSTIEIYRKTQNQLRFYERMANQT